MIPSRLAASRLVALLAVAAMLTACGIKGDLFIPERPDIGAADGNKTVPESPKQ